METPLGKSSRKEFAIQAGDSKLDRVLQSRRIVDSNTIFPMALAELGHQSNEHFAAGARPDPPQIILCDLKAPVLRQLPSA
jgi:hypothetical protein